MANELRNKRVAVLAENGFEQSELTEPKKALEEAGATVEIVSPQTINGQGLAAHQLGRRIRGRPELDDARGEQYDALLLPGGVMNPDKLRINDARDRSSSGTSSIPASPSQRSVTVRGRSSTRAASRAAR